MKKIIISCMLLFVILGIILFIPFKQVFAFEGTRNHEGQNLYIPFDLKQKEFQMIYTHSIHLTDVKEFYSVTNNLRIQSLSMEYEDVAIGMPGYAEAGQTLNIIDGKYYLTFNEARIIPNYTLHISNISSMQHFIYKDVEYDLKKILTKGASYTFSVKKISIFQWWKGGYDKYE